MRTKISGSQGEIIMNNTYIVAREMTTSEKERWFNTPSQVKKVEVLKKLKEKQEKEYYKEFLQTETKEIDDITSARFRFNDTGAN